ncbi:hypothetical protein D9M68_521560 [compost metagenome]
MDRQQLQLCVQQRALGLEHLELRNHAFPELRLDLRRDHAQLLHLLLQLDALLLVRIDVDQCAFHLFERRHHGPAIFVFRHAHLRLGGLHARPHARIEHGQVDARHEAEGEGLEQVAQRKAGGAAARGQADAGQLRQPRLANDVVGRQHAIFGRDDIGPARQQLRRQPGRHAGRLHAVLQAPRRHLEVARGHAHQCRQRVLRHIARAAQFQQVLVEPVDFGLLLHHADLGHQAVLVHGLVGGEDLPVLGDSARLLLDLLVELQDREVSGRYIGHQRQVAGAPVGLGRAELGGLRLHALLDLAPDIDIPVQLRAGIVGPGRLLPGAFLEARTSADIDHRQPASTRFADLRIGHADARGQHLDVVVAGQRLVDQAVQVRVVEVVPPVGLHRFTGRDRDRILARPFGLGWRFRALVHRRPEIGAAGQQRGACGGCEPGKAARGLGRHDPGSGSKGYGHGAILRACAAGGTHWRAVAAEVCLYCGACGRALQPRSASGEIRCSRAWMDT